MYERIYAKNAAAAPKLIAHRGLAVDHPQNTLPAFRAAGEKGFWAIETDVHMTKDGFLVCCHNETVDVTYEGTGRIPDLTWAEIQAMPHRQDKKERMPLFREYLEICKKSGCLPFLEVKTAPPEDILKEALDVFPVDEIIFSGIHLEPLLRARAVCPEIFLHHIFTTPEEMAQLEKIGNCGVSYKIDNLADAPEGLVQRVHDAGMLLCLRAADTREKALNMIAAGLDYMPTNKVTPAEVRP